MDYQKVDLIPLEKIKVEKHNVRLHDLEQGIEDLMASIKSYGLLQPITVYFDSEKQYYVILAGQRRFNAYDHLNEQHPDGGYSKIKCIVIDEPKSPEHKKALSLAENITQLPMRNVDTVRAVTDLYNVYHDYDMVREKFGLTKRMVDRYVRLARLPERLKQAINEGEISPNTKTSEGSALRAVDALNWIKNGDVSEEQVLELAIEYAKGEISSGALDEAAKRGGNVSDMVKTARKNNPVRQQIELSTEVAAKLTKVAKSNGESEKERASRYVVEGTTKDYRELED